MAGDAIDQNGSIAINWEKVIVQGTKGVFIIIPNLA